MGLSESERRQRLERLFEEHYAAVLAYGLRRTSRAVAEDVASETFVVASRRVEEVPADALPWLYGVARRVLANERRGEARRDRLNRALAMAVDAGSADAGRGDAGVVLAALARLPEPDREALMLVAWEGLSTSEAAAVVGCSRVAMRARLSRARRRLTDIVEADGATAVGLAWPSRAPARAGADGGAIERSG